MTGLLWLIRTHPDALEADLSARFGGMDLRDYWRRGADGRRRLTLRQIAARVRHLPPDSAVARVYGGSGWTTADYLLADVFHAQAGKPHPGRPKPDKAATRDTPERRRMVTAALARKRQRELDIAEGRIT